MQESCNLQSGIQLKETGIPPTIGIRNPTSNDKESEILYLESGILESKTVLEFLFKRGAISETPCSGLEKDILGAVISL